MSLRSCYEDAIDIYVNLKAKFEDRHKNNGQFRSSLAFTVNTISVKRLMDYYVLHCL
jgi:hypothetical protein